MKIESITLRELRMRLKAPFETSFGVTQDRRILLIEMLADGVTGWGEITTLESPSDNSETTDTAWHIVSDFIAPIVVGQNISTAAEFPHLLERIRGNHMAKAGVENALWDIEAQQRGGASVAIARRNAKRNYLRRLLGNLRQPSIPREQG